MNPPLISVIVPVYNAENTLRECVDSILGQNYRSFELLLIDDGSKDGSLAICGEYAAKDNRVKVFHKTNGGVSSARNLGLDNAQGEWITFIDSDDVIGSYYFNCLNRYHNEDFLLCDIRTFTNEIGDSKKYFKELDTRCSFSNFINMHLADSLLRGAVFKFYKKSLLGSLRFIPDMIICEDVYFVFQYLSKSSNFAFLEGCTYYIRVSSMTNDVKYSITVKYAINSLKHVLDAFESLVQVHGIDKGIFLHFISYFKWISSSDWQQDKAKWYDNPDVKALYDYVWPALSFKQKVRLSVARALKR